MNGRPPHPHIRLHSATRQLLDRIHRAGRPPMHRLSPAQAREFYDLGAPLLDIPPPALERVEDLTLLARDGHPMPARLYAPRAAGQGDPLAVLLYLHGGGFTVGSLTTHDSLCRALSQQGQCAVVSLDYRLAPEHRFPTAVEDAWDALVALSHQADSLGLDGQRLAVGGDSAGGTLAAVLALMARDAGISLALQLLFYPGTTAHQDTPSHQTYAEGFMLDKATVDWFFDHYIDWADRRDWRFAPLLAEDHSRVAPAWLGLAECDPLVDEGLAYGDVLRMAGVAVDLEVYAGVIHGFITMGRAIPDARQAHADAGRALRRAFQIKDSS